AAIVQKIYADTKQVLDDPAFAARVSAMGLTPVGDTPEEMAEAMKKESDGYARLAKARHLRIH
ncbi:MAG TPA: hypothetical protein VF038_02765, partial [Usitatibacter sp.]